VTSMERLRKRRVFRDGLWFMVDLDPSKLTGPARSRS
jgi:hypothetical protein